jgi:hypothetical protein
MAVKLMTEEGEPKEGGLKSWFHEVLSEVYTR